MKQIHFCCFFLLIKKILPYGIVRFLHTAGDASVWVHDQVVRFVKRTPVELLMLPPGRFSLSFQSPSGLVVLRTVSLWERAHPEVTVFKSGLVPFPPWVAVYQISRLASKKKKSIKLRINDLNNNTGSLGKGYSCLSGRNIFQSWSKQEPCHVGSSQLSWYGTLTAAKGWIIKWNNSMMWGIKPTRRTQSLL